MPLTCTRRPRALAERPAPTRAPLARHLPHVAPPPPRLRRYPETAEDCHAAIKLNPDNLKCYERGAKAELAQGRLAEAAELAQRGLLKDPKDEAARAVRQAASLAQTRLAKAHEAIVAREFDRALSLANTLLDTCPASFEFALLRIEALTGLRKLEEASTTSQKLMALHSHDTRLLVLRGRCVGRCVRVVLRR